MLRLPAALPAALRFLRLAVPRLCRAFRDLPPGHSTDPGAWGLGRRCPVPAHCRRGDDWASQVPGGPPVSMPCSSTPVGPVMPGQLSTPVLPSGFTTPSAPTTMGLSRLNDTACSLAVYASQHGSPRDHARLASGCWPALPGGVEYPLGPAVRFLRSQLAHNRSPPYPGFS